MIDHIGDSVVSGPEGDGPILPMVTATAAAAPCPHCQASHAPPTEFIYALGQLDVRMPSVGIEREFQQRERQLYAGEPRAGRRERRVADVLRANPHLARSVCFLLLAGGMPVYIITPTSRDVLDAMLQALEGEGAWSLVVGRAGPMAEPATCGGVLAPIVACDQLYAFKIPELLASLSQALAPVGAVKELGAERFSALCTELFERVASSIDNVGRLDSSRALNYLLVQHPGLFLAYAERSDRALLDSIETRVGDTPGLRRIVTVILTFLDRQTGVPERLFTRVDTTEEWPFLADASNAGAPTLGFRPFIDYGLQGSSLP